MGNISGIRSAQSIHNSDTAAKAYTAPEKTGTVSDNQRFDTYVQGGKSAVTQDSGKSGDEGRYDSCEFDSSTKKSSYGKDIMNYIDAMFGYHACTGKDGDSLSAIISCLRRSSKSNIMIDPRFYQVMESDPDTALEYIEEMKAMIQLDKQFERQAKANGSTVLARGWFIDKEGGISSWSVVKTPTKKNTYRERMEEIQKKIRERKKKRAKEQKLIEERRSRRKEQLLMMQGKQRAAVKERLKRKARRTSVYDINDLKPKSNTQPGYTISFSLPSFKP